MNVSIPSLLLGGAGFGVAYFLYLSATKGVPAAWKWFTSKLAAGSAELSKLRSDLAQLEQGAVADVKFRVAALETDVAGLKKSAPPTAPAQ
jgi:hypothetical protein